MNQTTYASGSVDMRAAKSDDTLAGRINRQNDRLQSCIAGLAEAEKKITVMRERLGLPPAGGPSTGINPKPSMGALDETDNQLNIFADLLSRLHGSLQGLA